MSQQKSTTQGVLALGETLTSHHHLEHSNYLRQDPLAPSEKEDEEKEDRPQSSQISLTRVILCKMRKIVQDLFIKNRTILWNQKYENFWERK